MFSNIIFESSVTDKAAQRSTRLAFFVVGLCMSSWAPLVPIVKMRAGIEEGALGLLLLCLGLGSICAMPVAGFLVGRHGCRRVLVGSALLVCIALPLLAYFSSVPALGGAIIVFGIGVGAFDCALNIQAVAVNNASTRPILASFHGLYSLGGIVGAIGMTALLGSGLSPIKSVFFVVGITVVTIYTAASNFLPYDGDKKAPIFVCPRGKVLLLGILCFIVFMAEGAILDWSGVFLVSMRNVDPAYGGLGYAAFAGTMTIARLTGDSVIRHFGMATVLGVGSLCASLGLILSLLCSNWILVIVGYAIVGLGCANIVPVIFMAVSHQSDMPKISAIPAITTVGYAGVLIGPAFIGFVAHASSIAAALAVVALLLLILTANARSL